MNDVTGYLRLVSSYCNVLGGMRWSAADDAIEGGEGWNVLFNAEIADFIEGFASQRELIHFCFMLHSLCWFQAIPGTTPPELQHLHKHFQKCGGSRRNAGAFLGVLCRAVPGLPQLLDARSVCERLRDRAHPIRWFLAPFHDTHYAAQQPPLTPAQFEAHIRDSLAAYRNDEVESWLRHGRGPVHEAAKQVARALPPASLSGRLAGLLRRKRLAGAANFVPQLTGALTLPPRRLQPQELPLGGYSDVTTRGHVDDILPSQFALDEWDFFRRYAENELLFFRREEPHTQSNQELVVVLDQGVRTWGDVRLVLGAALIALGKQALLKKLRFLIAATSSRTLIDPLEVSEDGLGALIEASDLTVNPGLALERLFDTGKQDACRYERDIVLLTHPRSLRDEEVIAAARQLPSAARLFALTLNDRGAACLNELRRGLAVPLREFSVDLGLCHLPVATATTANAPAPSWQGDVEPIGFPFRFGHTGPIAALDFEYSGKWLITASKDLLLHAWKVDGSGWEVLPRAMWQGKLLTAVHEVIGVAAGFIAVGAIDNRGIVAHYDLERRTCKVMPLQITCRWCYVPAHHCLIGQEQNGHGISIDLTTGEQYQSRLSQPGGRAHAAWEAVKYVEVPRRRLLVGTTPGSYPKTNLIVSYLHGTAVDASASDTVEYEPYCHVDADSGKLQVIGLRPPWSEVLPLADGQPLLRRCLALEAHCGGSVVALKYTRLGESANLRLHLFEGPEGVPLAEYPLIQRQAGYALSADGSVLARVVRDGVEVRQVRESAHTPIMQTVFGGFSPVQGFTLYGDRLQLSTGRKKQHVLQWTGGVLEHHRHAERPPTQQNELPECTTYDRRRFSIGRRGSLYAVADRFGQIALFDSNETLLCMFFAFRDKLAGWLPDGTRFGPPHITGGAPTADAMQKFGQVLAAAGRRS